MMTLLTNLHQRYEQTMAEYQVIEKAEGVARQAEDDDRFKFETAMKASCRETDALRTALLHQVPTTWTEAMILQYHIVGAFDLMLAATDNNDDGRDAEQDALQTAIDTLFDFMCCEVKDDHATIGRAFQDGANRAFTQRRYRTGVMED